MNLDLSGQKREELQHALLDAFPSKASLEQMLAFELGKNLDEIATDTNLQDIVFNLIKTAYSQNWIEDLINAARNRNPRNSKLKAIVSATKLDEASVIIDFNSCDEQDRNRQLDKKYSAFSITGSFEKNKINVAKLKAIEASLRKITGDASLQIVDIEEGSIRLILEGSQEGLERLEQLFKSGELTEVLDIPVEDVSFVDSGTSKDDKKRLAFTIAENATRAEIENLKAALIVKDTTGQDESAEIDEISRLAQEILQNKVRGQDLSGANLNGANLNGANLNGANLSDANLSDANLSGANFINTNFINANLSGAYLSGANLIFANFSGANLSRAYLINANLSIANLSGANLSRAYLINANLSIADLSSTNLSSTDLSGANLSHAYLINANFSGANLSGADLSTADLSSTIINSSTKLDNKWRLVWEIINQRTKERDLSGANLSNAYLRDAYLRDADLSRADLSGTNLSSANLSGANLSGANLSGTNLSNTIIDSSTKLDNKWRLVWEIVNQPDKKRNLSYTDLSDANLSGADLSGANLSGANLSGANLSGANLSGANLMDANIENARFGNNRGISEQMKVDLIQRGAIFEDSPCYRSEVLLPR